MLTASRRSLAAARLAYRQPSADRLLSSFLIGSSKDLDIPHHPFSTSTASPNNPRTRPTKAKLQERADKVERKRSLRATKELKYGNKVARAREGREEKEFEVQQKRETAETLAEGLAPLTEDELEGIYRGLLEAKPEELALPALVAPSTPLALGDAPDPVARYERLHELEERLDEFEGVSEEIQGGAVEVEEGETLSKEEGSLADRLRARREGEVVAEPSKVEEAWKEIEPTLSPARALIARIESLTKPALDAAQLVEESPSSDAFVVRRGLVIASEWRDLVLLSAEEGDEAGVERALSLMQSTNPIPDANLLTEVMAVYAAEGRVRDALSLLTYAQKNSLPLSVQTHHHFLASLLPLQPSLAIQHLHSLEAAGYTPLLSTYTLLITTLLSPSSPSHLVSRGWDLYAHTRLVSHPIPSAELYATMIAACASSSHPSPERAIDLFIEMTHDNRLPATPAAYNGLIRACARRGTQEYYFEALRFMRQMLEENVEPDRGTFHAVLEGARRMGDLPRARWMLVKMVGVGGGVSPDASSLGLVFQTYARFYPEVKQAGHKKGGRKAVLKGVLEAEEGASPGDGEGTEVGATKPKNKAGEQGIVDLLGESSLFYPGPLPRTTDELLAEAHNLMAQCVDPSVLDPSSSTPPSSSSDAPPTSIFPAVKPTTFLLNSYLALLATHAPFDVVLAFWRTAYSRAGVEKNRFGFETAMRRCEIAKNRTAATEAAREVFAEWKAWGGGGGEAQVVEPEEGGDEELAGEEGGGGRKSGRNISLMWAHMIRILARSYLDTESLALFQTFISLYPPHNVIAHAQSFRRASLRFPTQPSAVRLSSSLYPETRAASDRPPYLLFDQVRLLHLRLAEVENKKGVAAVKGICMAYEGAVRSAKEIEEGVVRKRTNGVEGGGEMEGEQEGEEKTERV